MVALGAVLLRARLGSSVCLSPFLPAACVPPSFDRHFLATKSVPGLCSIQSTSLAVEMLTAKLASATSQGGRRPGERQPLGGDQGVADSTGCPRFWGSLGILSPDGLRPILLGARDEGHRELPSGPHRALLDLVSVVIGSILFTDGTQSPAPNSLCHMVN